MTTVAKFRQHCEAYPGKPLQAWVSAFMERPKGLGQESLVYLGCGKKISPLGYIAWLCRKRLPKEGDLLADEHLNHCHHHDGDCSTIDSGIPCYALSIIVSDYSGSLDAEVWAPSMHLLGMNPSNWVALDRESKSRHLSLASKRPFEMLLMSVSHKGVFSHIKVQFVKPAAYHPRLESLGELATKFESITVEDDEEQSVCTAGVQFVQPAKEFPLVEKLKEAIGMIAEAYDKNAKAVSLLHEIMGHLPTPSST